MSAGKDRQATGWVKHYRLFLCLLLLTVLALVASFWYSMSQKAKLQKEGTLVRRVNYERQA